MAAIPIRRIRRDGTVDMLGEWRPDSHELFLEREGFPLTEPGLHKLDADLPWVFDEMAPDGYDALRFAKLVPHLGLPVRREQWSSQNVLDCVSLYGDDLPGNLIVGEESFRLSSSSHSYAVRGEIRSMYPTMAEFSRPEFSHSSVGGARPKMVIEFEDRSGVIVKFTPPLSTSLGTRWADLLRLEAHSAAIIRGAGIAAVRAEYLEIAGRGFLEIERFDRFAGGGRVGHVTLFNLGVALYGEANDAGKVIDALIRDRFLTGEDRERFTKQHAFSQAIANTDTHLGNYGLLIDDDGRVTLSPAYDVLPMAFAPRHDELPDRLVQHTGPRDADTQKLVEALAEKVHADEGISAHFKDAWSRAVL